jgi:hypothetical protein
MAKTHDRYRAEGRLALNKTRKKAKDDRRKARDAMKRKEVQRKRLENKIDKLAAKHARRLAQEQQEAA